jgi:hypothetical protein
MKIDNVGINEEYWKDKTLEEFQKAMKGKLRSDKIKGVYKSIPKASKQPKAKEVKKEDK